MTDTQQITPEMQEAITESNQNRLIRLAQRNPPIIITGRLLEDRLDALLDTLLGPDSEARAMFEYMFQLKVANTLDDLDEIIAKAEIQAKLAVPQTNTPSGLIVPGR